MLQTGKPACARGFREIVFYDERGLNFRNTGWYNKVLEKAGTYPVLGIKKMCSKAGFSTISFSVRISRLQVSSSPLFYSLPTEA